jgi:tRNA(Ile)-lysidine synthase
MLKQVRATISRYGLIERGDSVLIGLSGGPDSVALTHLLWRLKKSLRLSLATAYVNHGLRPRAAKKEEAFCEALCRELGIECHLVREDIKALAKQQKQGIEEAGRHFRYGVFEAIAEAEGCDKIAVGHHADDRVESILLNLFRGAGRSGGIGMPVRRGRIVRPLYECHKEEVLTYLKRHKLGYCLDRSNQSNDLRRNFVRNRLLPQIRQQLNPQADSAIIRFAETLAAEEEWLASEFLQGAQKCMSISPGGKVVLKLRRYDQSPRWLRARLLRMAVATCSAQAVEVTRETLDRLGAWLVRDGKSLSLPGGVRVVRVDNTAVFVSASVLRYQFELSPGEPVVLNCPRLRLQCRLVSADDINLTYRPRSMKVVLDAAAVKPPLTVRNIRPGDRFRPLGMTGRKKVSDFLIDRKVPRVYRDEIPVVCDRSGIVWLVGQEIDERVKVKPRSSEVMVIECRRQRSHSGEISTV